MVFSATNIHYFSYIVPVSFTCGGNRRKLPTCRKSLTNFITYWCIEYMLPWTGFELTTLVVIGTNCTGSCKSNYHTITIRTVPSECWNFIYNIMIISQQTIILLEEGADAKIRKSKKDRQHNDQKKKDKRAINDLQNITDKSKYWVPRTPLIPGGEPMCSGRIGSSCSTPEARCVTLVIQNCFIYYIVESSQDWHHNSIWIYCFLVHVPHFKSSGSNNLIFMGAGVSSICDRKTDDLSPQSLKYNTVTSYLVVSTSRSFPNPWLITGFVTGASRRMLLMEQELLTLPEHLSSPPVFSGVCVARSLILYVVFVDRCLSVCPVPFGHCLVCPSIYGFWLPLIQNARIPRCSI